MLPNTDLWAGDEKAERPPLLRDVRRIEVNASPERAFAAICRIGGENGWYYADWLWDVRLFLERILGGEGRRRRRHPVDLEVGDVVDCWRVEVCEPNRRVRFALELIQPGRGWLQFDITAKGGSSTICQTAEYDPCGIAGRIHWFLVSPIHGLMFPGMLRRIAEHIER